MQREDPPQRHKVRRKHEEKDEVVENVLYYKEETSRTRNVFFESSELDSLPEDKPRSFYHNSMTAKDPLFDSVHSLAAPTPEPRTTPTVKMVQPQRHRSALSWTGGSLISSSPMAPVCRSAYASLPKRTSAAEFLANFAMGDSDEEPTHIVEGMILSHRYKINRVVGTGAFSECRDGYDVTDESKGPLAFKVTREDGEANVQHEIAIWQSLKHPGFLPLLDVLKVSNMTITVSPLASAGNMLQYLSKKGPFEGDQAKRVFSQLSQALHYLHNVAGIIHRDIKLENILLDDGLNSYLCDFGLSEYIETSAMYTDDEEAFMKGSLWYLPPEIINCSSVDRLKERRCGAEEIAKRRVNKCKADVWSLGIVLYAMVSGHLPFTDDFLPRLQMSILSGEYPELDEAIDRPIRDLVDRILTVDVEERPSIAEVLEHPWLCSNTV